jgi:nitroreductase
MSAWFDKLHVWGGVDLPGGTRMPETATERTKFLRRLRSIKAYTPEPVADEVIADILEVGRWSGSASNRQPWGIVVVRDPESRRKLGEWGANPAPTAAVVFLIVSTTSEWAPFDEGRLAERLNLAALAHGLGSTVAALKGEGIAQAQHYFGIPGDCRSVVVVTVGHTDQAVRSARRAARPAEVEARKPMVEFAHWDRWPESAG